MLNNLEWWYRNGFFTVSADAIASKMQLRSSYSKKRVGHFIDCNCLPTSVVGGGPAEDGANSARWDDNIQRAFYNGWKSVHVLKHQTTDIAFGCTVDMIGPTSLRRNDNTLLRLSNINDRMGELQEDEEEEEDKVIISTSYNRQLLFCIVAAKRLLTILITIIYIS